MEDRNFIPKGRILRNKCGQIKAEQLYFHETPIFSMGYTLLSFENLKLDSHRVIFIPTFQTISKFLPLFLELSVALQNQSFLILQTILRVLLQQLKPQSKRQLRELLFNSPNMKWIIFYNENFRESFRSRRISFHESIETLTKRLLFAAINYLAEKYEVVPVIIAEKDDPYYAFNMDSQIQIITFQEFLYKLNIGDQISSVLENYQLLSIAQDQSLKQIGQRERLFSPHLSRKEIEAGINSGELYVGILKVSEFSSIHGEVRLKHGRVATSSGIKYDCVLISGIENMNRSIDGDTVVIQLLPQTLWKSFSSDTRLIAPTDTDSEEFDAAAASGVDEDTAESKSESISLENDRLSTSSLPTARIVAILNRELTEYVVTIPRYQKSATHQVMSDSNPLNSEEWVLCVPLNHLIPKIRIRTRQWQTLQGQRALVGIDNWPIDSRYPNGHFTKCLGTKGDWKTEIEALLINHSIFPRPFSVAAMACLPSVPSNSNSDFASLCFDENNETPKKSCRNTWKDSGWIPTNFEGRRDLRSHRIFSVDPPGCQDIDDAMSIEWISDGLVEISVHIADVCAFLEQGSPLDLEAQVRSTTVYLSHRRIDMLPSLLSSDIASLHGNKERYAVSMIFRVPVTHKDGTPFRESEKQQALELDAKQDIIFEVPELPIWAGRTVICSVAAMTYDQGDNLLNNLPPNAPEEDPVPEGQAGRPIAKPLWPLLRGDLCMLTVFSRQLQRARMQNGAIDLSQNEGGQLKFRLDENGFPVEVKDTPHKEIHDTIAELMILANGAAARIIYSVFPAAALFRSHTSPSLDKLREVQDIARGFGLTDLFMGTTDEELLNHVNSFKSSLSKNRKSNPAVVHLVTSMVIRAMSEARYISSENDNPNTFGTNGKPIRHYGLGVEFYTHFTSPIRRYADVIVHRELLRALEVQRMNVGERLQSQSISSKSKSNAVLIPESKAISILEESQQREQLAPLEVSHQIQTNYAPDGRKMFDKISSTSDRLEPSFCPPQQSEQQQQPATQDQDDDLDFLDSLLDGIGTDLADSCKKPLPPVVNAIPPSAIEVTAPSQVNIVESNPDDDLDALLGDVDENSLSAAILSRNRPPVTLPKTNVEIEPCTLPNKTEEVQTDEISPPYSSRQLASIADHLNKMNRRAKIAQLECQQLFLRHYFLNREEKHIAVVYSLKENGFMAYVPAIDFKGPVYLMTNDNAAICCHPRLLSLSNTAGIAASVSQHAGKLETIRIFPDYQCQLISSKGEIESESELVVCPRSMNPSVASGTGAFRLKIMQRVVVSVYSSRNQSDGIPELCLQLWSTDLQVKLTSTLNPTDHALSATSLESKDNEENTSQPVVSSLYRFFNDLQTNPRNFQIKHIKKHQMKKANGNSIMSRKISIQGIGRVAFGNEEERENFAPLFQQYPKSSTSGGDGRDNIQEGNNLRGKYLAMHQMKLYGEEWAEEEELPGIESPHSDDPRENVSDLPSAFNMRKEVNIANQRIQKLKIAKRNSKY